MKIKLASINCHDHPLMIRKRRRKILIIVDEIIALKPDIICFQEINSSHTAKLIAPLLTERGYQNFYLSDRIINRGGLFISSAFPIKKAKFFKFDKQGKIISKQLADRTLGKGFQHVTLEVNGENIELINTHLVVLYSIQSKTQIQVQSSQIDQLANYLAQFQEKLIVAGDLNIKPNSELYNRFINNTKLVDQTAGKNFLTAWTKTIYGVEKVQVQVDYIFSTQDWKASEQKIICDQTHFLRGEERYLSDHFGLFAKFSKKLKQ